MSSSSNSYCSVPQCSSWAKKNREISFHSFPKAGKHRVKVESSSGEITWMCRRKAWILKLKIGKTVTKYMLVSSRHFVDSDFFYRDVNSSARRRLKWTSVPSQNLPVSAVPTGHDEKDEISNRSLRLSARNAKNELVKNQDLEPCPECNDQDEEPGGRSVDEMDAAEALVQLLQEQPNYNGPKSFRDFEVQVNTPKISTLCDLLTSDTAIKSFTGVSGAKVLETLVEAVQHHHVDQRSHRLTVKERIVLSLTKMKCDLTYITLGFLFGISHELCKKYILEMLPILSRVLRGTIKMPDSQEIRQNIPKCFEDFQNVRVVLDCTEVAVQKPKCLCCRIRFYSQYKSNNTVKFMTGVSPGGTITYLSEPYGGRASDKTIFQQSNLILQMNSHKDAIMVDKGFLIDDICETFKIELIRPPFLRNQRQLTAAQALLNSKIAAARVHIERANQRIKIFKILNTKLPWSLVKHIKHIFTIACAVTNISSPILADCRFLSD